MGEVIVILIFGLGLPVLSFISGLYYIRRNAKHLKKREAYTEEKSST